MVTNTRESGDPRSTRRLNEPGPVQVTTAMGLPTAVGRTVVASLREEWRVSDRWWTAEPIRRRYFELVLETGENIVVFLDQDNGSWFWQRA